MDSTCRYKTLLNYICRFDQIGSIDDGMVIYVNVDGDTERRAELLYLIIKCRFVIFNIYKNTASLFKVPEQNLL